MPHRGRARASSLIGLNSVASPIATITQTPLYVSPFTPSSNQAFCISTPHLTMRVTHRRDVQYLGEPSY